MEIYLALIGIATGFMSGFFGIGGGTVLVPMLLVYGFFMKEAVAISIMQMVFSSIYGSFLNSKKTQGLFKDGIVLGIGGFLGGLLSGYIVSYVDNIYLQYLFILVISFSIYRVYQSPSEPTDELLEHSNMKLILIGMITGVIAMSIGVGGSIILTPILVRYMNFSLKDAASLGLFFVIFSSVAGFSSLALHGMMLYYEGAVVGIASLIGVYFGVMAKNITHSKNYKQITLAMYIIIFISMLYKSL